MAISRALPSDDRAYRAHASYDEDGETSASHANASAVAWGAVFAGAAAAAALSLILLILGVGLGLSSVSPWANSGVTARTFGWSTIVWLTLTQLLASALGGYLAGRLRTRWNGVQQDEVYFRDTAHGFLAWAVASLVTAAMLTSAIGSIVGGGVQAGAAVAGNVGASATTLAGDVAASRSRSNSDDGSMAYFVDALFRRDVTVSSPLSGGIQPDPAGRSAIADSAEVARIFVNAGLTAPLPAEDLRHVGQIVATRTGLTPQEAEKRVGEIHTRAQTKGREAQAAAKEAADQARKASAYAALWLFVSLLIGAFVASLAATFGGRQRDD